MSTPKRHIAILGSTGSIGTQGLDVVRAQPDLFEISVLTANNNVDLLAKQAREFTPNAVVIANDAHYETLKNELSDLPIKVYAGHDSIASIVEMDEIDMVLTGMVGFSGLKPTINAIRSNKHIGLANKETLVVAGDLIAKELEKSNVGIIPVDSEHSAIFQCLVGEAGNPIECIYLTASGGPFRGFSAEQLAAVTKEMALKHPNWDMGAKITIDSASMMNKGLEVIEAKWLFDLKPDQIRIVVHPQSVIHSIVQLEDGSMKAQMGIPDMKLPIQYALGYPERIKNDFPRFDFLNYPELTFEQVDTEVFRNVDLAYKAMDEGGNIPCILNAANEVAVELFLQDAIRFVEIPDLIEGAMNSVNKINEPNLEELVETDMAARNWVYEKAGTKKAVLKEQSDNG